MILIFTIQSEYSTSNVMEWLSLMGEKVIRLNSDDDNYKLEKIDETGIYFKEVISNKTINLREAKAAWWRRSGLSQRSLIRNKKQSLKINGIDLTSIVEGKNGNVFREETTTLIEYIYNDVYNNCGINIGRPIFNLNRLMVFDIAKKNGLKVPSFNIITDNKQLANTVKTFGDSVTKAISNGLYNQIDNYRFHTYTELIDTEVLSELNTERLYFPSLITKKVEKKVEVRTFYLDGQFYSMAISSQADKQTLIDFRKYNKKKPNRTEPFKLPDEIEFKLKNVFKELDLNCGSIDFIIDKDDNYIFLEINPVGQYAMVSEPCNYNLDKLIANYLTYGRNAIN